MVLMGTGPDLRLANASGHPPRSAVGVDRFVRPSIQFPVRI